MTSNQPIKTDELDLFDLFKRLWDGRAIIAVCIVFAMVIMGIYVLLTEPTYRTKASLLSFGR